ncbi:uncharacterized protein LOC144442560 [Glandiceps talaboti]
MAKIRLPCMKLLMLATFFTEISSKANYTTIAVVSNIPTTDVTDGGTTPALEDYPGLSNETITLIIVVVVGGISFIVIVVAGVHLIHRKRRSRRATTDGFPAGTNNINTESCIGFKKTKQTHSGRRGRKCDNRNKEPVSISRGTSPNMQNMVSFDNVNESTSTTDTSNQRRQRLAYESVQPETSKLDDLLSNPTVAHTYLNIGAERLKSAPQVTPNLPKKNNMNI